MVSGHLFRNDRLVERVRALRAALEGRGAELPDERIVECDSSVEAGMKVVQRLLEQRDRPTAIICSSDILGLAAILQCQKQGLSIPADISVVGSGDLDLIRYFSPKLSTLGSADAEIARTASNILLNRLRGTDMVEQIFPLKVDICWRETTGPAPSGMR
jgi:DNA-binding LacI/PurR family transcriptional regulator